MLSVLGIIVFVVHSWSIWQYLFYLPSFVLKYDAGEILAIFFYHMTFAFFESLLVCLIFLFVSALLPASWLRLGFVHKSFLLLVFAIVGAVILQKSFADGVLVTNAAMPYLGLGAGLLLLSGLLILDARVLHLQRVLVDLAERISVMLLVFLPLDAFGLAVVTIRLLR